LSGYFSGKVDSVLMRLADAQLAIPDVLLVIALVGISGPSLPMLIGVLGVSGWIIYARTVRAMVLSIRERTFVEAARAVGCQDRRILVAHILPNVWTPVIVVASQQVGRMILLESTLSFLGLGVPAPTPSWGGMIAGGRNYLISGWWIIAMPGLALLLTVMAVNFLGDGLQDVSNVRLRI
jgi:peptide/nickel transport system permease protein